MGLDARVRESLAFLRSRVTEVPDVAIICGSGLGGLADTLESPLAISYGDIPHFKTPQVLGHAGKLIFGTIGGKRVVCMQGRMHCYEGYSPHEVSFPVRLFAAMGVRLLIVTNAAGGLNRDYAVGDIVVVRDHIYLPGLAGMHALRGHNEASFGVRFTPMNGMYTKSLGDHCKRLAGEVGLRAHDGVYVNVSGPSFESPAEARALLRLGADCVGMSTVPETVVAAHSGVALVTLSLITNVVVLPDHESEPPSHDDVLAAVKLSGTRVQDLVSRLITEADLSALKPSKAAAAIADTSEASSSSSSSSSAAVPASGASTSSHPEAASAGLLPVAIVALVAGVIGGILGARLASR